MTTQLTAITNRCVGVVGGVFVCMGYAVRITTHAVDVVTGADKAPVIVAEASGVRRKHWGSGELHQRVGAGRSSDWGSNQGSPYASYAGTPVAGGFASHPASPFLSTSPNIPAYGLGLMPPSFGPSSPSLQTAATAGSPYTPSAPSPYTPSMPSPYAPRSPPNTAGLYAPFPPTPNPAVNGAGLGFPSAPPPPPPSGPSRRENGHAHPANGIGGKKDD